MDEARETSTPLLVYNRIDSNRRKARLLLISFAVALLPVVSGVAAFIVPWSAMYASGMRAYLLSRAAQSAVEFPDKQNDAEVYVDGYFAGTIKEFDGHLALTPGPHNIKVSAPGHEPFYQ